MRQMAQAIQGCSAFHLFCQHPGDLRHVAFVGGEGLREGQTVVRETEALRCGDVVEDADAGCCPCVRAECEEAAVFDHS